jgi:orotidine-5'-phosphate decarboxylase
LIQHFADRLQAAIDEKGSPVCVGIDPRPDRLPGVLIEDARTPEAQLQAVEIFCLGVLEAVAPIVPVVKPQVAYFEALGPLGYGLCDKIIRRARDLQLIVILDAKRNDIGSTAEAYANAHLRGDQAPDALTVNPYLGRDGVAPFVDAARAAGRGLFALVRTSNPSGGEIQDFADPEGSKLYEHVARLVSQWGAAPELLGECGLSCIGAVVGATYPDEARRLRELMPEQVFLVPGYGAQGATAVDATAGFRSDGRGGIVNASRSVIYAHAREEYARRPWQEAVAAAARAFADDIAGALDR